MCDKEVTKICDIKIDKVIYDEEIHPFEPFIHSDTKILIVGTFPPSRFAGCDFIDEKKQKAKNKEEDVYWYYGSKDNNFWKWIIEHKYLAKKEVEAMKDFARHNQIGFVDLFYRIKRYRSLSSDSYITPLEVRSLVDVMTKIDKLEYIFFTSEWVMNIAKKEYLLHNRELLMSLNKNTQYVEGNVFILDEKKEIGFARLSSPSPNNYNALSEDGKKKWGVFWEYLKNKGKKL